MTSQCLSCINFHEDIRKETVDGTPTQKIYPLVNAVKPLYIGTHKIQREEEREVAENLCGVRDGFICKLD